MDLISPYTENKRIKPKRDEKARLQPIRLISYCLVDRCPNSTSDTTIPLITPKRDENTNARNVGMG